MKRRDVDWLLVVVVAHYLAGYALTAPRVVSPALGRVASVFFFAGLGALAVGIVLRWRR